MRINTKTVIGAYNSQKTSSSRSNSQNEKERLQRHVKKTRDVLLSDNDEESFATVLAHTNSASRH